MKTLPQLSFEEIVALSALDGNYSRNDIALRCVDVFSSTKFDKAVALATITGLVERGMAGEEGGIVYPTKKGVLALNEAVGPLKGVVGKAERRLNKFWTM